MRNWLLEPRRLFVIGVLLMLLGACLPLLMIMQVIKNTFFLSFLSFTASTLGIMLGLLGVAMYNARNRK